ncbi:M20/M25/M40 family metallo-hydrolase [Pelomyxa schiedti]|nr:M20/M25/M40 family metallo-hydrolase [Pelomyxa schiedti]
MLLAVGVSFVVTLVGWVAVRTWLFGRSGTSVRRPKSVTIDPKVDGSQCCAKLATALRRVTVTDDAGSPLDETEFGGLRQDLASMFPSLHSVAPPELVGGRHLLFTWKGKCAGNEAVMFLAHQDVVPANTDADHPHKNWKYPPFDGVIAEGSVWGRGSLDDKGSLVTLLEAVELLIKAGYSPSRTVLLALEATEETSMEGARALAQLVSERKYELYATLDEGGIVMPNGPLGKLPVGMIAIGEKNPVKLVVTVTGEPGHSSAPPKTNTIGILAEIVRRIEKNPLPIDTQYMSSTVEAMGAHAPLFLRILFSNMFIFKPLLGFLANRTPTLNAVLRSTIIPTMSKAGTAVNIIPPTATGIFNIRLLPNVTLEQLKVYLENVIGLTKMHNVSYTLEGRLSATGAPIEGAGSTSEWKCQQYQDLCEAIKPLGVSSCVPFVTIGATSSHILHPLSKYVYRFLPVTMGTEEAKLLHGYNERLSCDTVPSMVTFYSTLIQYWTTTP